MATNLTIRSRRNEKADRLIKRFIKKSKKLGIIEEVKERRRYKKPSQKKREAIKRSIAKHIKEEAKRQKNN